MPGVVWLAYVSQLDLAIIIFRAGDKPNSIAHVPVPVPKSNTRAGSWIGARASLLLNTLRQIMCCKSTMTCQQNIGLFIRANWRGFSRT